MKALTGTWDRIEKRTAEHTHEMDIRQYIGAVTLFTCYGMIAAAIVGWQTMDWVPSSIWTYLGVGLVIPIVGIFIAAAESVPLKMFGYSLIAGGLGAILGPSVAMFESAVVINALAATAGTTFIMSMVGIMHPKSLASWGGYLFGALITLILVRVVEIVLISLGYTSAVAGFGFVNYLGALLFSLFIIYDWNRAVRMPRNIMNAIDCAIALFLDIVNLFIHLLQIMGGGSSSD